MSTPVTTGASAPLTQREPAVIVGAITSLVSAALMVAVAFGLKLTPDQVTALAALTAVIVPLVQAIVTRSKVVSPATAEARVEAAVAAAEEPEPKPRRALLEQ